MVQRKQGNRGTVYHRNIIQGSNGFTINGGTYANGDATTTIQYNLLVINVNGSPSLEMGEHRRLSNWKGTIPHHAAAQGGRSVFPSGRTNFQLAKGGVALLVPSISLLTSRIGKGHEVG
ncbi:hypothetical protein BKA70DRAFT_1227648 [Coprinopsis sp. MPI-PUGE-AT-0042]|nr:hypothetical protein BKA70DRAFT_1227648 [Coprinopsis sp. MPI-PUGE-AT-0042]